LILFRFSQSTLALRLPSEKYFHMPFLRLLTPLRLLPRFSRPLSCWVKVISHDAFELLTLLRLLTPLRLLTLLRLLTPLRLLMLLKLLTLLSCWRLWDCWRFWSCLDFLGVLRFLRFRHVSSNFRPVWLTSRVASVTNWLLVAVGSQTLASKVPKYSWFRQDLSAAKWPRWRISHQTFSVFVSVFIYRISAVGLVGLLEFHNKIILGRRTIYLFRISTKNTPKTYSGLYRRNDENKLHSAPNEKRHYLNLLCYFWRFYKLFVLDLISQVFVGFFCLDLTRVAPPLLLKDFGN